MQENSGGIDELPISAACQGFQLSINLIRELVDEPGHLGLLGSAGRAFAHRLDRLPTGFTNGLTAVALDGGRETRVFKQTVNGRTKYFRKNRLEWLDAIVDETSAAGINLLLSITRAPDFYAAPGGHSPADPQTLGDFLQFLATRYKGKVQAIEPWNEQNLSWEWGGARLWPDAPSAPPLGVTEFVALQRAA